MAQLITDDRPRLQATYAPPRPVPRPDNSIRLGRWDPVTGRVVYSDGGQAQSAFRVVKDEPKPEPTPVVKTEPKPKADGPKAKRVRLPSLPRAPRPPRERKPRHNATRQPTIEQVRQALSLYGEGTKLREVARRVGLGYHLTGDMLAGAGVLRERPTHAKVSTKQAAEIRQAPGKQRVIAEQYGICRAEVNRIKRGRVLHQRADAGVTRGEPPRTLERDLLRARLLQEFAPILNRWGVEGPDCYRRNKVVLLSALTEAVTRYIYGAYLVEPGIADGDSLGEAIDKTADMILAARRRTA